MSPLWEFWFTAYNIRTLPELAEAAAPMTHANLIKPNHKAVAAYYAALKSHRDQDVSHEGALETAFSRLLNDTAHTRRWTLIPKLPMKSGGKNIAPDGTLKDEFNLRRGYWEAKDTHDDLDKEIRKKIEKGYPLSNTIFEDTRQAVLFQNGQEANRFDLEDPQKLADLLNDLYSRQRAGMREVRIDSARVRRGGKSQP